MLAVEKATVEACSEPLAIEVIADYYSEALFSDHTIETVPVDCCSEALSETATFGRTT